MKASWLFKIFLVFLLVFSAGAWSASKKLGKVAYMEGAAQLIRKGKTKTLRVNMPIRYGDKIVTQGETRVEIVFSSGSVVRVAENSEVLLDGTEAAPNPKVTKGKLWANIQKMNSGRFVVSTKTATAAVRGTVFRVQSESNSSSVALYEGRVDVGPADTTQIKNTPAPTAEPESAWGPPKEVAPPSEVSLATWVKLDPGKMIQVGWSGYSVSDIDNTSDSQDAWVRFNQGRDASVSRTGGGGELEW
jgi:hypothetical protein